MLILLVFENEALAYIARAIDPATKIHQVIMEEAMEEAMIRPMDHTMGQDTLPEVPIMDMLLLLLLLLFFLQVQPQARFLLHKLKPLMAHMGLLTALDHMAHILMVMDRITAAMGVMKDLAMGIQILRDLKLKHHRVINQSEVVAAETLVIVLIELF